MPSIALMTIHANFPWFRQIPGGRANGGERIGAWRFTLNTIADDCALVVVYDEPLEAFSCALPPARRILITSEPPGMKRYYSGFANQFGTVMGPVDIAGFRGQKLLMHPALAWFYGIKFSKTGVHAAFDYDALAALEPPHKQEMVSIILSKKAKLPKHRARLAFVAEAQRILGDKVRVFGRGFEEVADKAEAITPYAYHIVLENNDLPHFWTEKMADSLLGWALPIFSGCKNIGADFPEGSFIPLDIRNPQEAALRVKAILEDAPYAKHFSALADARKKLMEQHNLFFILIKFAEDLHLNSQSEMQEAQEARICPNLTFAPLWGQGAKWSQKIFKRLRLFALQAKGS